MEAIPHVQHGTSAHHEPSLPVLPFTRWTAGFYQKITLTCAEKIGMEEQQHGNQRLNILGVWRRLVTYSCCI